MQPYWTKVATPYFFAILGFGILTLFSLGSVQLTGQSIGEQVAQVLSRPQAGKKAASAPA